MNLEKDQDTNMDNYGHLLTHMGVLTSFSISKKIDEKEINAFVKKKKKQGLSDEEIHKLLNEKLLIDIDNALKNKTIPGLVTPLDILNDMFDKRKNKKIKDLSTIADSAVNLISRNKYTNVELCYFINCLINHLELKDSDFKKFHQLMNKYNSQSQNDDDEYEDDEDTDDSGMDEDE